MNQVSKHLSHLCMSLLLVTFTAFAQQQGATTGGLNGAVTDQTGAVLPGATVVLVGPQGTRTLTTDSLGRFNANGLTPGFYDVTVTNAGFKKWESKHNEIVVNTSSTLNVSMLVGNVGETVEVTASAVGIDTQSTAITTTRAWQLARWPVRRVRSGRVRRIRRSAELRDLRTSMSWTV